VGHPNGAFGGRHSRGLPADPYRDNPARGPAENADSAGCAIGDPEAVVVRRHVAWGTWNGHNPIDLVVGHADPRHRVSVVVGDPDATITRCYGIRRRADRYRRFEPPGGCREPVDLATCRVGDPDRSIVDGEAANEPTLRKCREGAMSSALRHGVHRLDAIDAG